MESFVIYTPLIPKAEGYELHKCRVSQTVSMPHSDFVQMMQHPTQDNTYIKEHKDQMHKSGNTDHCVLFIDEETGNGMLVQSDGNDYAMYSQFIPNAKTLASSFELKEDQQQAETATEQEDCPEFNDISM